MSCSYTVLTPCPFAARLNGIAGYYDDVEFVALGGADGAVQVRSSSRIGYLDFGVNAKRLNWIAKQLRNKGWDAEGVNLETHQFYKFENEL